MPIDMSVLLILRNRFETGFSNRFLECLPVAHGVKQVDSSLTNGNVALGLQGVDHRLLSTKRNASAASKKRHESKNVVTNV